MKKKWMVCMIACLMILLAGCNGNTAKETARNDTDKRISSTAGSKTETAKSYEPVQVTKKPDSTQEQKQPQQQPQSKPETPTFKE